MPRGKRPEKTLELYEFEVCPWCRRVREAISLLDLEVLIKPCSKNGPRYRPWVIENGGQRMFPYLVDPNTDVAMYESKGLKEEDALVQARVARILRTEEYDILTGEVKLWEP